MKIKSIILSGVAAFLTIGCLDSGKIGYSEASSFTFKPKDTFTTVDDSEQVLQGIERFSLSGKTYYLTTQNVRNAGGSDIALLFNLYNSSGKSIANTQVSYASHGQDLSVQNVGGKNFIAYTTGSGRRGAARFNVNLNGLDLGGSNQQLSVTFAGTSYTNLGGSTPTLSSDKKYMLIYSGGKINVYGNGSTALIKSIPLQANLVGLAFQGIAMSGDTIYTIHGNHVPSHAKYTSQYSLSSGALIKTTKITPKDTDLISNWEVEGLTMSGSTPYTSLNIDYKDGDTQKYYIKVSSL